MIESKKIKKVKKVKKTNSKERGGFVFGASPSVSSSSGGTCKGGNVGPDFNLKLNEMYKPEKEIKRGSPSPGRLLTPDEMKVIKNIEIVDLIRCDRRFKDFIVNRVNVTLKKKIQTNLKHDFFASSIAVALVHETIIKRLLISRASPLRGFNRKQIEILMLAFSIFKLSKTGFFNYNNFEILGNKTIINQALQFLAGASYVEEVNNTKILRKAKTYKRTDNRAKYYKLTRQAVTVLNEYFKAYEKLHNEMHNSTFELDLYTINAQLKSIYE